jgi:hypothetical protein
MSTSFQITIVAPGRADAIAMTRVDPAVIASLPNRSVRLGNNLVGKVVSCEAFKTGSTLVKMQIADANAQTLLYTGCLSAAVTDDKAGELVLRDIATPDGVSFGLQRSVGEPVLQKRFCHAPTYEDKDVEAEKDARLQDGLRKQFTALTLPFFGAGNSARGIGLTPLEFRKAVAGGRHRGFRSHNG